MMRLSQNLPRFIAAMQPRGTPITSARSTAMPPILADTGNLVAIISDTVQPRCLRLKLKSPWRTPAM